MYIHILLLLGIGLSLPFISFAQQDKEEEEETSEKEDGSEDAGGKGEPRDKESSSETGELQVSGGGDVMAGNDGPTLDTQSARRNEPFSRDIQRANSRDLLNLGRSGTSLRTGQKPKAMQLPSAVRSMTFDRSVLQSAILENNAVVSQARKTGMVNTDSLELAKFGLTKAQVERFQKMQQRARNAIMASTRQTVRRLLSMDGFGNLQADAFFEYQPRTRALILGLEDDILVRLLNEGIEEDLLQESLSKLNLDTSNPAKMPTFTPGTKQDERAKQMSVRLMEGGNGEVLRKLNELSDGGWSEEILRTGEVADILLRDYDLGVASPRERLSAKEALANPFFVEVAALFDELKLDQLVNGGGQCLGGKNLIVRNNAKALQPYVNEGTKEMLLVASESLEIPDNFNWDTESSGNVRLVMMTPGEFTIKPGSTLKAVTSDLVLATQRNLLLKQVSIHGFKEVVIRGYRDVSLEDVSMHASALATIMARRDLNVDGLTFNQDISRIVMEATTMRLKDVTFPVNAQVRLNSLKGAIDGRYPNFGSNIPAAQQIGRVNFIENVRSGGNLLHDRASFDQHGQNIQIGKIARP